MALATASSPETPQRFLSHRLSATTDRRLEADSTSTPGDPDRESAYMSRRQRCCSAGRLIVEDVNHAPLLRRSIPQLNPSSDVGEPTPIPRPFLGPVIDNAPPTRLHEAYLDC